jgi:hypothetical protein
MRLIETSPFGERRQSPLLMLWTAPPPGTEVPFDVGAAPSFLVCGSFCGKSQVFRSKPLKL